MKLILVLTVVFVGVQADTAWGKPRFDKPPTPKIIVKPVVLTKEYYAKQLSNLKSSQMPVSSSIAQYKIDRISIKEKYTEAFEEFTSEMASNEYEISRRFKQNTLGKLDANDIYINAQWNKYVDLEKSFSTAWFSKQYQQGITYKKKQIELLKSLAIDFPSIIQEEREDLYEFNKFINYMDENSRDLLELKRINEDAVQSYYEGSKELRESILALDRKALEKQKVVPQSIKVLTDWSESMDKGIEAAYEALSQLDKQFQTTITDTLYIQAQRKFELYVSNTKALTQLAKTSIKSLEEKKLIIDNYNFELDRFEQ